MKGRYRTPDELLYQPPERVLDVLEEMRQLEKFRVADAERILPLNDNTGSEQSEQQRNKHGYLQSRGKAANVYYAITSRVLGTLLWAALFMLIYVFLTEAFK